MANKLIPLKEAVTRFTRDNMVYASGAGLPVGSDSIVFGMEMVRQGRKHIHYMLHSCSQQVNLFCAAGTCDRVEAAFSGLEVYGFANGIRKAVESGRVIWEDWSNLAMVLRFMGAALGWPFVPATVNIGSDLQWRSSFNPDGFPCKVKIPDVIDPFTGKVYGALPVARPELAVIHVTMADIEGNAIVLGTEWSRYELARAAGRVILQADYIVDTDCMRQYPNLVRIPDFLVSAVIPWQLGAWPQCSVGVYDSDEAQMNAMNTMLGTREGYESFREKYIDSWQTHEEFLAVIGEETIERIMTNATTHLMDPYRKWVKEGLEIRSLMNDSIHSLQDRFAPGHIAING
jgi:glutaconate CoA-transferase subunit A